MLLNLFAHSNHSTSNMQTQVHCTVQIKDYCVVLFLHQCVIKGIPPSVLS